MNIYLDIETIPSQVPGYRDSIYVSPPASHKKPDTIEKWMNENFELERDKLYRKTALDGMRGQIICVCLAAGDGAIETIYEALNEDTLLSAFYATVNDMLGGAGQTRKPFFIGHNINFDLKFLWKRSVIRGVVPTVRLPHDSAPWKDDHADTMTMWDIKKFAKLTDLCEALGIDSDDDIPGSEVWDAYQDGRHNDIARHCQIDVERVREVYQRLTFAGERR